MKLLIEVQPNSYNDHGYHYVIYKKWWFLAFEFGRLKNKEQVASFILEYDRLKKKKLNEITL